MLLRAARPRMTRVERIRCLLEQTQLELREMVDEADARHAKERAVDLLVAIERITQRLRYGVARGHEGDE